MRPSLPAFTYFSAPCKVTEYFTSVAVLHLEGCTNSITNVFKTTKGFSFVWSCDQILQWCYIAYKIVSLMKKIGFVQPIMLTSLNKFDKKIWMLCTNIFFPQLLLLKTACVWRSETFHLWEKLPSCFFPHAVLTCFHQLHRVTSSTLKTNHRLGICSYQLQIERFLPVRPQHSSSNFPPLCRGFVLLHQSIFFFFCFLPSALQLSYLKAPTSKKCSGSLLHCRSYRNNLPGSIAYNEEINIFPWYFLLTQKDILTKCV